MSWIGGIGLIVIVVFLAIVVAVGSWAVGKAASGR
jgi:hypothetical protein